MWFGGEKVEFDHKMLWFWRDFGVEIERKNALFCPLKIGKNIDDIGENAISNVKIVEQISEGMGKFIYQIGWR